MKMQNLETGENQPKRPSFFRRGFFVYILIIAVIVGFGVGVVVGQKKGTVNVTSYGRAETDYGEVSGKEDSIPEYLGRDVDFKVFWELWNQVQADYIDAPVGETQLFYGALRGMVAGIGDPYSSFFEPQETEEFYKELDGKFEGIGAEIGIRHEVLTVVSPLSGSPAEKSGLRAADVILKIDGVDTLGMGLNEAVNRIRGEKGTKVVLSIYRGKSNEFLEVEITRDEVEIESVKLSFIDKDDIKIGYIEVSHFNSDTAGRFSSAVNQILLQNPDGLILDLRSNPGGYMDTAVELANYWLEKDKVVVLEKKSEDDIEEHKTTGPAVLSDVKTVVLINGGSASSSEILSGALQDYGLATLIGEKSFGKGSVQKLEQLSDGSSVKLTIARWLTPNGRQIDNEGIAPDIEVEMTVEDYDENRDPQLDRAIEFLSN